MTIVENLLNSTSKDMTIDGSSVSVVFSYSPVSGSVLINSLSCLLQDEGDTSLSKFGSLNSLTNGILIKATIGGQDFNLTVIKDNADLITRFSKNHFGSSAVLSILGVVTPEGFGNSNNIFVGRMEFTRPLLLTNSDSISVVIRDNLSNIDLLNMACEIGKDLS